MECDSEFGDTEITNVGDSTESSPLKTYHESKIEAEGLCRSPNFLHMFHDLRNGLRDASEKSQKALLTSCILGLQDLITGGG
ncbi:unnamed protein product [Arabis nemorensis]|uniref:Uncharacterized protein n=1 Tax=Arabis nemorensis TaxID=586526 RepID=A0A565BGL2_9BRAS|nr:unnamed protein product [Arabis nemorensis]